MDQPDVRVPTDVGNASGIARLVPTLDRWELKAHLVYTKFESLKGFPKRVGKSRDPDPNHGQWEEQRRRESEFKDDGNHCWSRTEWVGDWSEVETS